MCTLRAPSRMQPIAHQRNGVRFCQTHTYSPVHQKKDETGGYLLVGGGGGVRIWRYTGRSFPPIHYVVKTYPSIDPIAAPPRYN